MNPNEFNTGESNLDDLFDEIFGSSEREDASKTFHKSTYFDFNKDIREIEKQMSGLHDAYLRLKELESTQSTVLSLERGKIDGTFQSTQQSIKNIQKKYQNRIESDKDFIAELTAMVSRLNPKYTRDYVAGRAVCPQSIDLDVIRFFHRRVLEDTGESFTKRLLRIDGYYDWKQMTLDFMRKAEEAELYLQRDMQNAVQACNYEIQQVQQSANLTKQQGEADYQALERKQKEVLASELQKLQSERQAFLSSNLVTGFNSRMISYLYDTGYEQHDWTEYNPARPQSNGFSLGKHLIEIEAKSVSLTKELEKKISCFRISDLGSKAAFHIPYIVSNDKNHRLYYHFSNSTKREVADEIQDFILKKLRSFPVESIQTYVVDPLGRGSNLGVLKAEKEANEAIGIYLNNSKDDIRNMLSKLEHEIDDITAKLGKCSTVKQYNSQNKNTIPERVLVLFDFPEHFSSDTIESLSTIIRNSDKCGIDVVISSSYDIRKLNDAFPHSHINWSFFLNEKWTCFDASQSIWHITLESNITVPYSHLNLKSAQSAFIDKYREIYADSMKIDNSFSSIFDSSQQNGYKDATNGIVLPVMIRNEKKGELCDFVIGANANSTHALITGSTGSGKSSFLHMLITSILLNYHPDDVEFWMIDYGKVEFAQYASNRPASIRFLSTERSEEFTFSFLDYMKAFFEHRAELFAKEGVTDIKAYRAKCGRLSMPRVILMIDEFHIMTQQVQQDIRYKNILENSLTDYRKYGLSCIFSNQTLSALNGLSDTGKKQIKKRIAMMNSLDEMKMTLDVQSDNYSEDMIHRMERTATGELWCKEQISDRDFTINQFMAVYIDDKERSAVLNSIVARPIVPQVDCEVHIINDSKREEITGDSLGTKNSLMQSNRITPIHMGVPVTIEREFYFNIEARYNHNILVLGRDLELSQGLVEVLIANIHSQGNTKLLVFADQMDDVYQNLQDNGTFDKYNNIEVLDNTSDICIKINELYTQIKSKMILRQKTFILWLGYPDVFDEFNVSPPKKDVKFAGESIVEAEEHVEINIQKALLDEELIAMAKALDVPLEDLVCSMCQVEEPLEIVNKEDYSYNACDDVNTLIQMGGKFNLFNTMVFASHSDIRRIKGFDLNTFIHKIATSMPKEESYEWGLKAFAADLEAQKTAVYYDGEKARKFRPYIIT